MWKSLKNLLKEIREKQGTPHPKSKVFLSKEGKPIHWGNFYHCWAEYRTNRQDVYGEIEILGREGKVGYYLKPYATRHSFITWQLAHADHIKIHLVLFVIAFSTRR